MAHRTDVARIPIRLMFRGRLAEIAAAHAHPRSRPAPARGQHQKENLMTTPDALTVGPSKAELQVAYLRKAIVSFAPVLLAGLLVLSAAVNAGHRLDGVTWVSFVLAIAQAAGTFFPSNAVAKLVASLALAVGSALVAAATDGGMSLAEALLIGTQFLAWAGAGIVPNGVRPDVASGTRAMTGPEPA